MPWRWAKMVKTDIARVISEAKIVCQWANIKYLKWVKAELMDVTPENETAFDEWVTEVKSFFIHIPLLCYTLYSRTMLCFLHILEKGRWQLEQHG